MIGFEYWADPSAPTDGFITWQVDGKPSIRVGASAVGPDTDATTGSGVGQRLIPEEPMVSVPRGVTFYSTNIFYFQSIVLNLGISGMSRHLACYLMRY